MTALFDGIENPAPSGRPAPLLLIADPRSLRLAQAFAVIGEPTIRLSIVELVERTAAAVGRRRGRRR